MFGLKKIRPMLLVPGVSLTLFFCLWTGLALAAVPSVVSIFPSSGWVAPDKAVTFSAKYSDSDGWQNLREVYLLAALSPTPAVGTVYLYYDQNTNLLYLRNDADTAWLGGFAPGSANTIENSQVKVNCALSKVTGLISSMTVKWNLAFKPAYSGKLYNFYMAVNDDTGSGIALTKKGACAVTYPPLNGTLSPSAGSGQIEVPQTFVAGYSDADGWENMQSVYFLMSVSGVNYTNCLFVYYDQNTNKLYLRNDANTLWLGGFSPGSGNVLENSYAKLYCAQTTISGGGTALSVNWSVASKQPFTGTKNTYLIVKDDFNAASASVLKGTWTIPNNPPQLGVVTPSSGSSEPGQSLVFSAVYTDPDTWLNLQYVYLLINDSTNGSACFYAYYNQNTNKLYLRDDADAAWLGGFAPGSANTIENSYVKLFCLATTVSGAADTLTVNWNVSFKSTFSGVRNTYLYAKDDANSYQGWTQKGDFCIFRTPVAPPSE